MDNNTYRLTADDVKALRAADSFSFNLNRGAGQDLTSISCIRKMRARKVGPFERAAEELRHDIELTAATTVRAHFFMMFTRGSMQAVGALVRPGDILRLYAGSNNNQYMDNAGLYHDELTVTIIRPACKLGEPYTASRGDRRIVDQLLIMSSQCPQNSARAVMSEPADRYSLTRA